MGKNALGNRYPRAMTYVTAPAVRAAYSGTGIDTRLSERDLHGKSFSVFFLLLAFFLW